MVGKKKVFFFLKDKSAELASALIEATIKGGERMGTNKHDLVHMTEIGTTWQAIHSELSLPGPLRWLRMN